jgi:transposase, IS5 family
VGSLERWDETGRNNPFKARLDQIIDMRHPRVLLAQQVPWRLFEQGFGAVYSDGPGRPPLKT